MDDDRRILDLQRTFVPPPGLARSRPRDVQLTAAGKSVYVVAALLMVAAMVAGVGLSFEAERQAANWRAFDEANVQTTAQVTRLWRRSSDGKPAWVAYSFQASGRVYSGESRLGLAYWRTLEVGSTIAIRYLPDQPGRNVVASAERKLLPPWVAFVVAFALGGGGVLCLLGVNRQRRLLMEGRPAPARITEVKPHKGSHGATHQTVRYTFPLLSGATGTGLYEGGRKAPEVGNVICVVYDPDQPHRSRPYPFPLVRV